MGKMRQRMKITGLYVSRNAPAVFLLTKHGRAAIPLKTTQSVYLAIGRLLPHHKDVLMNKPDWSEDELKKLLVGKYLYGISEEVDVGHGFTTVVR